MIYGFNKLKSSSKSKNSVKNRQVGGICMYHKELKETQSLGAL